MIPYLLFRPIPYADETAASLLIRAAEENGHKNVYQLLAGKGIRINELGLRACLIDPPRYRGLVQSLGLADDAAALALERVGPSRRAPRYYRSIAIPDILFRRHEASAFCAECLIEAPYLRQQWLIRPFSVCVKHLRLLVAHCLSCGKVPSIGRGNLTRCNHCKTSLLEMYGTSVCVDSMISIQRMMDAHDIEPLGIILEFWETLLRFDEQGDQPSAEHARLDASVSFALGGIDAENYVAGLVEERLSSLHPRIQLEPFMSGTAPLKNFAEGIVDLVSPLPKIGTGLPSISKLGKGEVCRVLDITALQLAELIESGNLKWPQNGGRQRKISITDVEFMLHGFSLGEREVSHLASNEKIMDQNAKRIVAHADPRDESDGPPRLTWESFWRGEI